MLAPYCTLEELVSGGPFVQNNLVFSVFVTHSRIPTNKYPCGSWYNTYMHRSGRTAYQRDEGPEEKAKFWPEGPDGMQMGLSWTALSFCRWTLFSFSILSNLRKPFSLAFWSASTAIIQLKGDAETHPIILLCVRMRTSVYHNWFPLFLDTTTSLCCT